MCFSTLVTLVFLVVALCWSCVGEHLKADQRIVGGTWANITDFPYQVSLQNGDGHVCGGSIIHSFFIVTAAHCVDGQSANKLLVRAGSNSVYQGGVIRRVCGVTINDKFNSKTFDSDIALIKLCQSLTFGPGILPISLPSSKNRAIENTVGFVTGYGITSEVGKVPTNLKQITVRIVSPNACKYSYKNQGIVTNKMICASCSSGICDSCQGDSGGPFVAGGQLVGVVSWGNGCARLEYPGVYTRVSYFRKWIKAIVF